MYWEIFVFGKGKCGVDEGAFGDFDVRKEFKFGKYILVSVVGRAFL